MDQPDGENIRWVLDRQKDDYRAIKIQSRRYLLAILSAVVVLLGVWYSSEGIYPSEEQVARNLAEIGMFWQLDLLAPETAEAVVDSLMNIPAIIGGIGGGIFLHSIWYIYQIEQAPSCHPTGNAAELVNESSEAYQGWVEANDEVIEKAEKLRRVSLELGEVGIILMGLASALYFSLAFLLILHFILLALSIQYLLVKFHSLETLKKSKFRPAMGVIVIFNLLMVPLYFVQNIDYGLSSRMYLALSLSALGISLLYLKNEAIVVFNRLYQRYFSFEIDGWGYK